MTEVEKRAWRLASEEKARALKEAKEAAEMELERATAAAKKAQVSMSPIIIYILLSFLI